jgi:para-nitrobenzyl esterase
MRTFTIAAVFFALILATVAQAAGAPPAVRIESGVIAGRANGPANVFRGVPFAAAPVGALRWAPPQPAPAWRGVRDASADGPACPQPVNPGGQPNGGGYAGPVSEDCLSLNITAPKAAHKTPVMVWIFGGANVYGANSVASYDARNFARDGVILVAVNYRLGALGFFAHPALTRAAKPGEPLGSYAIMDQIAALKWVRRNIAAFGGDPANVTVFGESAGGGDTLTLLATPASRGLYRQAMVESGGGWSPAPSPSLDRAEVAGSVLAQKLGAPPDATLAQLRALPVEALANAPGRFGPIVDGRLIVEDVPQAFARGHNNPVPLVIGTNSYEASLMQSFGIPQAGFLAGFPPQTKAAYAAEASDDAALARALFTDSAMGAPARWIAGKSSTRAPTWLYYFSYVRVARRSRLPGANHASEIPYVFESQDVIPNYSAEIVDEDRAVARIMHACVVGFAKTGQPNCPGGQAWPAYTPATDQLLEFGTSTGVRTHFRKPELDALEKQNAGLINP